jgi:hypothetical protein
MTQPARETVEVVAHEPANPLAGSSLVPMLVAGLVLSLVGMIAAVLFS